MKKILGEFVRRGLPACGLGPLVLAVVYLALQKQGALQTLPVSQVVVGIFSLSALAFVAGGMNVVYQIERLPLMWAILIHGGALYISYLLTYLLNDWLARGPLPLLVFTGIFLVGYLLIWAIIYAVTYRSTASVNEQLKKLQQAEEV